MKESFENGFGDWTPDGSVPLDPRNPGHSVEWNITRVTGVFHSGQYALKFFIDGFQDDGTIWIERKITVRKNSQVQINITFEFYSESEFSANTVAAICAYVGIRTQMGSSPSIAILKVGLPVPKPIRVQNLLFQKGSIENRESSLVR
jgi:hypothetical protein